MFDDIIGSCSKSIGTPVNIPDCDDACCVDKECGQWEPKSDPCTESCTGCSGTPTPGYGTPHTHNIPFTIVRLMNGALIKIYD